MKPGLLPGQFRFFPYLLQFPVVQRETDGFVSHNQAEDFDDPHMEYHYHDRTEYNDKYRAEQLRLQHPARFSVPLDPGTEEDISALGKQIQSYDQM